MILLFVWMMMIFILVGIFLIVKAIATNNERKTKITRKNSIFKKMNPFIDYVIQISNLWKKTDHKLNHIWLRV